MRGMKTEVRQPVRKTPSPAWLLYLVCASAATGAYFLIPGQANVHVYVLIGLSMLAAILFGIRRNRPDPALPWYVIAFGLSLFVAGDVVFFEVYEVFLGVPAPYPSIADALYFSSYVVTAVGLALLIRRRGRRDWSGLIDAGIVAAALGVVAWVFLMQPYAQDRSLTLLVRLVSIAWPVFSLLWIVVAARLWFAFRDSARPTAFYLLLAGILFHPLGDVVYSYLVLNDAYSSDLPINATWMLSYAFFGAAVLHPSMREFSQVPLSGGMGLTRPRLALLGAGLLVVPALYTIDSSGMVAAGSVILIGLLMTRMLGLVRENERSEEELRALTQDLERRVQERTAQLQTTVEDLRESQARTGLVLEAASDGIWEWDVRTGESYWNESLYRLLGYSPGEVKPSFEVFLEMVHPEDRPAMMENLNNYLERGGEYYQELRMRHASGQYRVYASRARVRRDENGAPVRMAGTVIDITERKRYEEELRQAKEAAEAANRAKSDFLANMSHEIRTPMNGVIGMTGLLLDTDLSPEQREYTETVRTSGENLLMVINDILDFSKIEAGKMDLEIIDFDLGMVVEEALGLFAERAQGKGLELASLVEHDVPKALRGDPGRLTQVLNNLLGNAVKFTERGEVILRASLAREENAEAVVRFEVRDSGIGMTEEQRSRLFRSFSQADPSTTRRYGGTGLGLAISKQLVELMGGEIGVHSEPGEGSTFFFEVPFAKQPESSASAPASLADLRELRVLVVDDNEANRKIMHHQVTSWGMKNGTAENGPKALQMLRSAAEDGEPYDVVILDMQMPQMDGVQLARAIKAEPAISRTRLIMLSSLGRRVDAQEAEHIGIDSYLTKPVNQSKLYDAIATVMGAPAQTEPEEMEARPAIQEGTDQEGASSPLGARVLVAEDNAVNQKVAVKMLERLGYRADVAANGLEAVEALSRIPYPAVLMDLQMPEMDGYEATAEIRRREEGEVGRRTPIIAMTANAMEGDREKALAAGMDGYVSKPVKPGELGRVLARWVSREEKEEEGSAEALGVVGNGSGSHEEEGEDPLDRAVLESLRELGGPEMLSELAEMFFEDTSSGLATLKETAGTGEAETVERVAHTLKGSAGNMGAKRMATICDALQEIGAAGDLSRAPELIWRLEEEFGRVRPALAAETANVGILDGGMTM